jgi:hypothetical protein
MGITLEQVNRAALSTQGELASHGFWFEGSRLLDVDVVWCKYPSPLTLDCWGMFLHGQDWAGRLLGFTEGHIYIPSWSIQHFRPKEKVSLRDVVRHEYAHALADQYGRLIQRSTKFREVFGGGYWDDENYGSEDERDYVSDYATTMPKEDFAETFMVYLRHKGVLPERFKVPAIKRKWSFIRELGKRIGSGHHAWQ